MTRSRTPGPSSPPCPLRVVAAASRVSTVSADGDYKDDDGDDDDDGECRW